MKELAKDVYNDVTAGNLLAIFAVVGFVLWMGIV
jgi:hypothetical protein